MTRRWALAAAFFLTAIFGFVVVAYGSSTDMFAWTDGGGRNNAGQPVASPQATPAIVTDFVYVDGTAEAQPALDGAPSSGERERDHEEREHEREHDDDDDGYEHEDDD